MHNRPQINVVPNKRGLVLLTLPRTPKDVGTAINHAVEFYNGATIRKVINLPSNMSEGN